MKRLNASVMTVAVVLALIAFVAPSSAYSITTEDISCASDETTWIFTVSRDSREQGISHWVVFWCDEDAVKEVWIDNGTGYVKLNEGGDPGWEYMPAGDPDPTTGYQGIKIDYGFDEDDDYTQVTVKIILLGDYCEDISPNVPYVIKYSTSQDEGFMYGPVAGGACTNPIPEFSTIAIPIASILGLLFFFNHRKRREK
jgi:hypothetical protein